nr:hypothetical protein MtrunA17_Chr8g0360511 [Ipomoea batatas]GME06386.1 hypothetical protein MtrunA17_Chr8g0360511 [Ipomoea batatas]GME18499.1 hypothetical protein MtrunA17_Chr8g0360511 [Ipomoea batatas]
MKEKLDYLRKQRENCYACMTTNDSIESLGPDNIKCCDPKESLFIICSSLFKDLSSNWDSGVYRILTFGQYLAMPAHSDFTMPALMLKRSSRVIPGFLGTPAGMMTTSAPSRALPSRDLLEQQPNEIKELYLRSGIDVANIGSNARSPGDIEKGEVRYERIELHEQRKRLADPAGGSQDGDFPLGGGPGRKPAARDARSIGRVSEK